MKKSVIIFFILFFTLNCCKSSRPVKSIRILILSLHDLSDLSGFTATKEKYNLKLAFGPFFSYYLDDKKNFKKEIHQINRLKLDSFIPDDYSMQYDFKYLKQSFNIPNFCLLLSDIKEYNYRKYFKQFLLKNYMNLRILVFALDSCNDTAIINSKIRIIPKDIKILFLNSALCPLPEYKDKYTVIIRKNDLKQKYQLIQGQGSSLLEINRSENVEGVLILEYDLKQKKVTDTSFNEL